MTREDDDDDRVGYGKPPKRTRFRPGQSGNPRGRSRAVDFKDWENPIQKYIACTEDSNPDVMVMKPAENRL